MMPEPGSDATRWVQREIDGGGHVRLEPGTYIVRTLQLRSGLTLEIPAGTTLLAHPENNAFDLQERLSYDPHADMETSDFAHGMLVGRDLDGIEIIGAGTIDMARTRALGSEADRVAHVLERADLRHHDPQRAELLHQPRCVRRRRDRGRHHPRRALRRDRSRLVPARPHRRLRHRK